MFEESYVNQSGVVGGPSEFAKMFTLMFKPMFKQMFKHVVRNLNVRPDSSLWQNRDSSVLLGSCESKQGQGGTLSRGGMWKIPWIQLSSWGNNITWSSWGIKISHPLWTIRWLRDINSGQTSRLQRTCLNQFQEVVDPTAWDHEN